MAILDSSNVRESSSGLRLALDVEKLSVLLLGAIVIALPKMGVPLGGGVPLYGSVLVGEIIAMMGWYQAIRHGRALLSQVGLAMIYITFLLWVGHFMVVMTEGISTRRVARMVFNFLPFTALGIAFYIIHKPRILERAVAATRWGFYFLLAYSALQLVLGADTVAIQYITANYDQSFDEIVRKTNVIHRLGGDSFKLFGTYQNGNLFSIALILIAPFAFYSEKRLWVTMLAVGFLHVIIVFSASTTSYLSLSLMDIILLLYLPRLRFFLPFLIGGFFILGTIYYFTICADGSCKMLNLLQAKLFERDLTTNARWDKSAIWFESLGRNPLILFIGEMSTAKQFIFEVLPFSIAQYYGIFCLFLFYTFLLMSLNPLRFRLYKVGLTVYLITSVGSGGFWLTPTPYLLGLVCGLIVALDQHERQHGPCL